jgi:Acyl-CoA reductase (LuxC)
MAGVGIADQSSNSVDWKSSSQEHVFGGIQSHGLLVCNRALSCPGNEMMVQRSPIHAQCQSHLIDSDSAWKSVSHPSDCTFQKTVGQVSRQFILGRHSPLVRKPATNVARCHDFHQFNCCSLIRDTTTAAYQWKYFDIICFGIEKYNGPLDRLEDALSQANVVTQTVGIFPESRRKELRNALAAQGVQRVTAIGSASWLKQDWHMMDFCHYNALFDGWMTKIKCRRW